MDNGKRKRLGEAAWRELLARFAASGLSAAAFCRREAISAASFYRKRPPTSPSLHAGVWSFSFPTWDRERGDGEARQRCGLVA